MAERPTIPRSTTSGRCSICGASITHAEIEAHALDAHKDQWVRFLAGSIVETIFVPDSTKLEPSPAGQVLGYALRVLRSCEKASCPTYSRFTVDECAGCNSNATHWENTDILLEPTPDGGFRRKDS